MDSCYRIGDDMGPETLNREYKQIVVSRALWDRFDADSIVLHRVLTSDFADVVYKSVSDYFIKYLPRYVASMSRTPGSTASLIFGVDDNGTITGCPTLEGFNASDIIAMILPTLRNMRGVRNGIECSDVKAKYLREIHVSVSDLRPPVDPTNLDDVTEESSRVDIEYNRTMATYHAAMADWRTQLDFYNPALETICNDPVRRAVFLKYCEEHSAPDTIISRLKSRDEITFKLGTVTQRKADKNTMDYWITEFKDHHMRAMADSRPERPGIKRCSDYLKTQLSHLKIMNGNWVNDVRYQIIVITIRMNDNPAEWIEYRKNSEWISSIRTTSSRGDPCCEETFDCGYDGDGEIMFPDNCSE